MKTNKQREIWVPKTEPECRCTDVIAVKKETSLHISEHFPPKCLEIEEQNAYFVTPASAFLQNNVPTMYLLRHTASKAAGPLDPTEIIGAFGSNAKGQPQNWRLSRKKIAGKYGFFLYSPHIRRLWSRKDSRLTCAILPLNLIRGEGFWITANENFMPLCIEGFFSKDFKSSAEFSQYIKRNDSLLS